MVTIDLPNSLNTFPTFHTSQALPFVENDKELFPGRELQEPGPMLVDDVEEYFMDCILDKQKQGCGVQYLVQW